jgi:glucose-1-phosphate thymidylyltransferase
VRFSSCAVSASPAYTLTIPKPLIPIVGNQLYNRLVEDIAGVLNQEIEEVAFIIHETLVVK